MPLKKKLTDFLDETEVKYVTMIHSKAYTAQEVAASCHIPGRMFAKTVILKANGEYIMAVLPATHKINLDLLRQVSHSKEVELATEEEFESLFPKSEIGAMPPFGNLYNLKTYVDSTLAKDEDICFNAMTHSEVIKMRYDDFERLVKPIVGTFSEHI
ncbi:MAG: YbaK/EbsC family protein [Calditrichaeota bacterium]|nr:YbaK/EbsC family protein [Calditrichota bacterium]RQV93522.1 MAG: YbaK/EbsC family protein [bacterium]RQW06436.1 MAG: YbaK/EbsC family protein [Calditrichota bacterium]